MAFPNPAAEKLENERVVSLKPWERRPGESEQAFAAFQMYMTCRQEQLGGCSETARRLGKHVSGVNRWCSMHSWIERYRLYENHQLAQKEAEQQRALRQTAELWAARRIDVRETGFDLGQKMMDRARHLLNLPVYEKEVKKTVIAEHAGQVIETLTILNFNQHPRDARMFAESASRLMRLAADMATDNINVIASDIDLEAMTDEELDAYADKLLAVKRLPSGDVIDVTPKKTP
jgi:hypothetical protein